MKWISELIPLDRPEYAKQPEALLTDLFWRSPGSSLSKEIKLSRDSELIRLVPRQRPPRSKSYIVETMAVAEEADVSELILHGGDLPPPVKALLHSIIAPRSRQDKSLACVPIHPDVVVLQTLAGLVNKLGPPNLARIIETVGWLGGSEGIGQVASSLLRILHSGSEEVPGDSFTKLTSTFLSLIAQQTWNDLVSTTGKDDNVELVQHWPGVRPNLDYENRQKSALASYHPYTPFTWFWRHWNTLCTPDNGWHEVLPVRRFTDWAMCLLRTGLSFAYLWEADFYVKLHALLVEEASNRAGRVQELVARKSLRSSLENGTVLATFESPSIPASQKHAWNAMHSLLARGYIVRKRFENIEHQGPDLEYADLFSLIDYSIESLSLSLLEELSAPIETEKQTAINTREFVRYLLRPRSSDDDTRDQADFYYLALTNSRSFWFEPGPEWLVVVTSLLSRQPGGTCTLGMLLNDLRKLGIRVDRWVLVDLLENAGLSSDSPDADNALVIRAGF